MKITIPSHLSDDTLIAEVKSLAGRGRENTAQLVTTVRLLAPHLTEIKHQELLASAAGKSKREVDELLAWRQPRPDVAASVRKLPAPKAMPSLGAGLPSSPAQADLPPPPVTPLPPSRPVVSPLAPDRYQIRFTASASVCAMLRQAQDLLRHAIPSGDTAQIIERALRLLLQDLARKKFASTDRPRQSRGTARGSRDLPAKLQREVWRRDDGRCAYVGTGGRRCNTRAFLEFHHVEPYGIGGEATVDKIELRCRAHSNYEAESFYGRRWPERHTRSGTSSVRAGLP
jgi:hypothetical protein